MDTPHLLPQELCQLTHVPQQTQHMSHIAISTVFQPLLQLTHALAAHKDIPQIPLVQYVDHAQQLTLHAHGLVLLQLEWDGLELFGQPVPQQPPFQPVNGALEVLKLPYPAKHHTI